ncbi:hypothetical protein PZH42_30445, partial [Bacteroides cellulosilyticus]
WGGKLDPNMDVHIYNDEIRKYGNVNNNILSFFDTGITSTNAVAFSKTNDLSAFRVSVSDMRNWDIVPESELSRTSVSFMKAVYFGSVGITKTRNAVTC